MRLYGAIEGITVPYDLVVATPDVLAMHRDNPGLIYGTILREGRRLYAA